jgi:uncharacterized protein (TIGR00255 family)
MRSMTGFGLGEVPIGSGKLGVEIRGVNHRFLDVRVRLPRELAELSGFVEGVARERLVRGRYEVALRIEGTTLGVPVLDRERARAAFVALSELRDELAPGREVPLSLLGSIPDLFVSSVQREADTLRNAARAAFNLAVAELDGMRQREGAALGEDLRHRLERIRHIGREIEHRSPEVLDAHRRRLRDRADRLRVATELEVDPSRLEQELTIFAERCDISEELTRLESHCVQLAALLTSQEAVGRRLDFLLQEMAREANTVGAKSPDAQISHMIVDVKAEIERMREQVQNVE